MGPAAAETAVASKQAARMAEIFSIGEKWLKSVTSARTLTWSSSSGRAEVMGFFFFLLLLIMLADYDGSICAMMYGHFRVCKDFMGIRVCKDFFPGTSTANLHSLSVLCKCSNRVTKTTKPKNLFFFKNSMSLIRVEETSNCDDDTQIHSFMFTTPSTQFQSQKGL